MQLLTLHTHSDGFSLADTDRPCDASTQTLVQRHRHGQETPLCDGGQGHATVRAVKLCAVVVGRVQNPEHRLWGFLLCEQIQCVDLDVTADHEGYKQTPQN